MPVYDRNGRAEAYYQWNRFPTSRLPAKYQVDSPVTSSSQWEFMFNPGDRQLDVAPASCNEFTLGSRLNLNDIGIGDTIFNRCRWDRDQVVEYTIYSTSWGTGNRNGNGRNRNQVLMWTQQDRTCCATEGRGDRVTQGVWHFETLDGTVFHLPRSESESL